MEEIIILLSSHRFHRSKESIADLSSELIIQCLFTLAKAKIDMPDRPLHKNEFQLIRCSLMKPGPEGSTL